MKRLFLSTVIAAAVFGDTAGAGAATQADERVIVARFFEAIYHNDGPGYSQVAPQVYIMAAPDFAVPMSLEQARQAFDGCRLDKVEDVKALEQVPGTYQILSRLVCPEERHKPKVGLFVDDRHVVAVYPGGFPPPRPHS